VPNTSSDDILELTDIVEEGKLPEEKTESSSESSFEDELDALFGDVEDLDDGGEDTKAPPIDPNEELDMPDMSDLDSLLDDIDGNESTAAPEQPAEQKQVEGVDELLADLLPDAPADVEEVIEEVMPAEPETPPAAPAGEDDFDALLASLDQPEAAASTNAAAEAPAGEPAKGDPTDDIDAMFAELDQEAGKGMEPDDEVAASSAPAETEAENTDNAPLEDLDALIDDIMAPGTPGAAVPAAASETVQDPDPAPDVQDDMIEVPMSEPVIDDLPAAQEDSLMPEENTAAEAVSSDAEEVALASEQQAADSTISLEELAEKLAQGPLFAAIQNMIGQELDTRFSNLEAKLAENMDKSAATAAAKVIREEIAALLQDL
jgi:AAA ATPase containing von Willebrand factor type A (vWA) domain